MTLYRNRYRIESTRLSTWDYTAPAWYFVTICTRDRACVLGEVRENALRLFPTGRTVAEEWVRTRLIRPYVKLDAWVIMPDHLHGILRIESHDRRGETPRRCVSAPESARLSGSAESISRVQIWSRFSGCDRGSVQSGVHPEDSNRGISGFRVAAAIL